MMNNVLLIICALLAMLIVIRTALGPTIWDRLLGLNLLSPKILLLISLYALVSEKAYMLDYAIVYALLGFVGILFIARFIRGKGSV